MHAAAERHLTLLVPGLLGPAIDPSASTAGERAQAARMLCEGLEVPALARLLARAARRAPVLDDDSPEALVFDAFGAAREGPDWPVAAVTRAHAGGAPGGDWWLRADPVHLRADMGDATLFAAAELDLDDADEAALAAEVGAHASTAGFAFEAHGKSRWYLRADEPQALATWPLSVVAGTSVGARLPRGEDARRWSVFGNEIQMLLHASPVNARRESRGLASINGVWLWGGGRMPTAPAPRYAAVWSGDPLVAGLADLSGSASRPAPGDAGDWLARAPAAGEHLCDLMHADAPARRGDLDAWRDFLARLERDWAAPLLAALAQRRVASLTLRAGACGDFHVTRRALGRWWRRASRFAEHVARAP